MHTHLLNALKTSLLELLNATKTHPFMANVDYLSQMKYNKNNSNATNAHPIIWRYISNTTTAHLYNGEEE